jgi:hypothetical protein
MPHCVLIGDSILDNASYAGRDGSVLARLQRIMPEGDRATLLARDGAVIEGIKQQLGRLPSDASFLVISAGGNDALRSSHVLLEPAQSVAEGMSKVLAVRDSFATAYQGLLDDVAATGIPAAVCTIYDVMLPDVFQRRIAKLALGVLNDVITRQAVTRSLPIIDLRVMLTEERHFANPIEPSEHGSDRIAAAIVSAINNHPGASTVHTGL